MSVGTRLTRTWSTLLGRDVPAPPPRPDADPFLEWVPAGHFYSIVPGPDDVARAKARMAAAGPTLPGIDLTPDGLVAGFRERAALVRDWDGGAAGTTRYGPNEAFGIGDASMLRATILLSRPRRIIEVGSGWSSACTLDTLDEAGLDTAVTFIEPYPENLYARLRPADRDRVEIRVEPLQAVPTEVFSSLSPGDILFIDSSHVFKPGSDVDDYFDRVLPAVPVGVHVHIHDIFWPFEVPVAWLDEGRGWNEGHALRNFLYGNAAWEVTVFNDYFLWFKADVIEAELPQVLRNPGGSVWLRRVG
ncbi:MAG: class I SAM-dependent methyltransferase [Acidimicrobiales bacterium]